MKIFSKINVVLAAGALLIGTSCVSSKKHNDLMADRDAIQNRLDKSNADKDELNAQIAEMESMQSKLKTDVANGQRDLEAAGQKLMDCEKMTAAKEAQLKMVKDKIQEVSDAMSGSNLSIKDKGVKLHVSLANEILYLPGHADISKEGNEIISQLADVFKESDLAITVQGHTDSKPIRRTRYLYKDNWDLSCARASNVVRALEKAGVASERMTASGRSSVDGQDMEIEGAEAGASSRRIEFIITPSIDWNGL
jgi:chemotaxis protein MotB